MQRQSSPEITGVREHARVVPDVSHRKRSVLRRCTGCHSKREGCKIVTTCLYGDFSLCVQSAAENAVLAARDWPDVRPVTGR